MSNILITGASGGFGRLITQTLLKAGHVVAATMRGVESKNRTAADELSAAGARVIEMDVTDDDSVQQAVSTAIEATQGIDVVINNAGVGVLGWQETFTLDDWKRVFDINLFGVQRVNRAILPHMRERRAGLLVHISSLLGRMVIPFFGPYNASKHALEALADNYRVELSGFGIESIIVEPGAYGTGFERNLVRASDDDRISDYGDRAGAPDESIASFDKIFERPDAPDPQWVADAVAELIRLPRGQRPFRTVVDRLGMGAAIEPYNKAAEEVQRSVYTAFGMAETLTLRA